MMHIKWYLHEPARKRSRPSGEVKKDNWTPRLSPLEARKESANSLAALAEVHLAQEVPMQKRQCLEASTAQGSSSAYQDACSLLKIAEKDGDNATQRSSADEWGSSSQGDVGPEEGSSEGATQDGAADVGVAAMLMSFASRTSDSASVNHEPPSLFVCSAMAQTKPTGLTPDSKSSNNSLTWSKATQWAPQWQPKHSRSVPADKAAASTPPAPLGVPPGSYNEKAAALSVKFAMDKPTKAHQCIGRPLLPHGYPAKTGAAPPPKCLGHPLVPLAQATRPSMADMQTVMLPSPHPMQGTSVPTFGVATQPANSRSRKPKESDGSKFKWKSLKVAKAPRCAKA
mmetsp:Transcript_24071/g.61488  ORF Transcript_24071/g.61488 Transcript_24071/m.61488 type:complete len:341 (-) Transcript_24071:244-1266(-)|eukprot:CAMPEP_0115840618 /NCGR_PEP_ID=MMETSP0287-20121206/6865_1 /TAXON_ID=412157 /ORGANISM="Chrysochromulina rotalis, Strain UIO044" /LENGTH=340 /DNA_ID=CAMNT_0003294237 /DNA_START=13 /DNA_END=1035 /DNA_ORIENTATION=-